MRQLVIIVDIPDTHGHMQYRRLDKILEGLENHTDSEVTFFYPDESSGLHPRPKFYLGQRVRPFGQSADCHVTEVIYSYRNREYYYTVHTGQQWIAETSLEAP